MKNKTVREIVKDWLIHHGYDGLYNDNGECGCIIDDLIPCQSEGIEECKAGYKVIITEENKNRLDKNGEFDIGDWMISLKPDDKVVLSKEYEKKGHNPPIIGSGRKPKKSTPNPPPKY